MLLNYLWNKCYTPTLLCCVTLILDKREICVLDCLLDHNRQCIPSHHKSIWGSGKQKHFSKGCLWLFNNYSPPPPPPYNQKACGVSNCVSNCGHFEKKSKKKLCIDLRWREMRSELIFGHPKWPPAAILWKTRQLSRPRSPTNRFRSQLHNFFLYIYWI